MEEFPEHTVIAFFLGRTGGDVIVDLQNIGYDILDFMGAQTHAPALVGDSIISAHLTSVTRRL